MAVFKSTWTLGPVLSASEVPETSLIRRADWSSQAVISGPSCTGSGAGVDVGCACGRVRVSGAVFGADVGADLGVTGVDVLVGRRVVVSAGCAVGTGRVSCFIEGLALGEITGVACWNVSEAREFPEGLSVEEPQPPTASIRVVTRPTFSR